jgi:hypothetical protein
LIGSGHRWYLCIGHGEGKDKPRPLKCNLNPLRKVDVEMVCNENKVCDDAGMAKSRKGKLSSIQVEQPVAVKFKQICDSMPMSPSMARVAAGLVDWFGRQKNVVRMAIVGGVPEGTEHAFADALEALADQYRSRAEAPMDKAVGITPPHSQSSPGPANGSRAVDPPPARRPGMRPTSARAK